jgi:hypothetical protein
LPEVALTIRALEGLSVRGEEKDIVWEIQRRNREGEIKTQVMAAVKELKRGNWRSMRGMEGTGWTNPFPRQDLHP